MKHRHPNLPFLVLVTFAFLISLAFFVLSLRVMSQTRERRVGASNGSAQSNSEDAGKMPALPANAGTMRTSPASAGRMPELRSEDVVKVDVDLVNVDALVLQKKTARVVGGLKKEDFVLFEDGTKQEITHFSQDTLPLSVLLLIDRGGCLDPFNAQVHRAASDAISRLKPSDEVAVMTYHDTTRLLQGFTRDRSLTEDALNRIPTHDEMADHCLNTLFFDAADYMVKASNPVGRRVVIAITGVTRNFDCPNGPSGKTAAQAIYESGSVVCGIIPRTAGQRIENGVMIWTTRIGRVKFEPYLDIQTLANETGGEILEDKPENLNTTFQTLMNHLRSRYNLAFVSSNKKRDGTTRKLRIDVTQPVQDPKDKLVVKARRSYVAPRT
jgi:Ca-activated chloride channel homolog